MVVDFSKLSLARAQEFRDHMVAAEPYELRALARAMARTGGPIELMDASIDSLVPLWTWHVAHILDGSPGVPADAYPSDSPDPIDYVEVHSHTYDRRSLHVNRAPRVAGQWVHHYLRLVAARIDPPAPWNVYVTPDRRKDWYEHRIGILRSDGAVRIVDHVVGISAVIAMGELHDGAPDVLAKHFQNDWFGPGREVVPQDGSILIPYLDLDLGPRPPAAISPVLRWATEPLQHATPAPPTAGTEMTLFKGRGEHLDDPRRLHPLPADQVATALTAAGFRAPDGGPVTPADLTDGAELAHHQEVAQAAILTQHGKIRAVHLEPATTTPAQWDTMLTPLNTLAHTLRARLLPDDQLDDD